MIQSNPTANEHFVRYVKLLRELHELIAAGKGDDEEADAIRDRMDEPWRHLSSDEIAVIDGLSADFYTLGETRAVNGEVPIAVAHEFKDASERGDWKEVLRLVRQHEDVVPPDQAAGQRGMAWARLGLFDVAIPFFQEALRLAPGERMYRLIYLTGLIEAGHTSLAVETADEIRQNSTDAALLLKAAEVYFVWASTLSAEEATDAHLRAIEFAENALEQAKHSSDDPLVKQLSFYTHVHLSLSWKQLGELQRALRTCQNALAIDPNNFDAILLMEHLTAVPDAGFTEGDFSSKAHRAIALKSRDDSLLNLASSAAN